MRNFLATRTPTRIRYLNARDDAARTRALRAESAAILFVPVVMAIAAAGVRLLPLTDRVSLFIGPSLLIGCFAGFDQI
jgi:hypothetical protein